MGQEMWGAKGGEGPWAASGQPNVSEPRLCPCHVLCFSSSKIILLFHIPGRLRFASVRLQFGDKMVRAVPVFGSGGSSVKRGFLCFQYSLTGKDGSGFGSWKTPEGPKIKKNLRFRARLKISSKNEIFERATYRGPIFCG